MKKRIISFVLAMITLFAMTSGSVSANVLTPTITLESIEAEVGDELSIKVLIENNPGIWGMDLRISYDKSVLTLTSVDNGDFYQETEWTKGNLNGDVYILSYEANGLYDVTASSGVLAVLNFKISDTAEVGDYAVSAFYNPGDIININFDDINFTVVNGTVRVAPKSTRVTGVTIDERMTVEIGETKIPGFTVFPADATNQAVTFKSSDTSIATVDSVTGAVTGVNEGTATITVTTVDGTFIDTCTVTVPYSCQILGHVWSSWIVAKPATCDETGMQGRACTVCFTYESDVIPATGHAWGEWTVTTSETCITGGEETRICANCNEVETEVIPAGEHTKVHVDIIAPKCHYTGNIEYEYCTECDTHWTMDGIITNRKNVVLPRLKDTADHYKAKDPTCLELGNVEYWYCDECDQYWLDEALTQLVPRQRVLIETLAHTIAHVDAVKPTCMQEGNMEYQYCSVCATHWTMDGRLTNAQNVKLGLGDHVITKVDAKDATCTENGNVEYQYCSVCGTYWTMDGMITNSKNVITPATGHSYDPANGTWNWNLDAEPVSATYTVTCANCGETKVYDATVTATVDGDKIIYTATVEGDIFVGAVTNEYVKDFALGHVWSEWIITTNPTCTEEGTELRTCANCDTTETKPISATGVHIFGEWVVTTEPTTTAKGEKIRKCENCDATETEKIEKLEMTNPFTDIKDGQWYTDGILWCYHSGYMAGVSDTEFGRKSNVTRAMFATILAKIDGSDISGYSKMSFTDVKPNQWYSNAIEWAASNGYAAGLGEGIFGYKQNVSREQIALFFYTYFSKNGIDVSAEADLSSYVDLGRVHSWALDALEWAVAKGLISGTSESTLSPRDSATRAEIALIIKNYVEKVKQ
ncbi:MAG: S-layer homology domain-containing protein [Clostridia bacterium]|nr:S-layer homology domain-containing protein [Clostridia bacterium]